MRASDKQATAELLIAIIEAAIARGRRHYSERGELLATTLEVLECPAARGLRHRRGAEQYLANKRSADVEPEPVSPLVVVSGEANFVGLGNAPPSALFEGG